MKYFTAKDAKNQFGHLLDQSRTEPAADRDGYLGAPESEALIGARLALQD
jgi:hypothetical protein